MVLRKTLISIVYLLGPCQALEMQIYNRCLKPLKPLSNSQLNLFKARFFTAAVSNAPSNDNLFQQMVTNPCMEIETQGYSVQQSKHFVIYGTCNLERMFRFVLRQSTSPECWTMQLNVWNSMESPDKDCGQLPLSDSYSARWSQLLGSQISLGAFDKLFDGSLERKAVFLWCPREFNPWLMEMPRFENKYRNVRKINRTECSCCREDILNGTTELKYDDIWNAHCGQRLKINISYWIIGLIVAVVLLVTIVYALK